MEKIFAVLAGPVTGEKRALCNAALVDWQVNVRKKKIPRNGCPFYSPSSTNTNVRVFFATTKNEYEWQLTLDHMSGFPGSLAAVLKTLYAKRALEWVSNHIFFSEEICIRKFKTCDSPCVSSSLSLGTEKEVLDVGSVRMS